MFIRFKALLITLLSGVVLATPAFVCASVIQKDKSKDNASANGSNVLTSFIDKVENIKIVPIDGISEVPVEEITKENIKEYTTGWPELDKENITRYDIINFERSTDADNTAVSFDVIWRNTNKDYGGLKETRSYTVDGFKSIKEIKNEEFDEAVNNVQLLANGNVSNILISSVRTDNVKNYLKGWPASDSIINAYQVNSVTPVSESIQNTAVDVTVTWINTTYNFISSKYVYTIDGFMSVAENDVYIERIKFDRAVKDVSLTANDHVPNTLVTTVNKDNILHYIDKFPDLTTSLINDFEIVNVSMAENTPTNDAIKVEIIWKNSSYGFKSDVQTYVIKGFRSEEGALEKITKEFNEQVESIELTLTDEAKELNGRDINLDNFTQYIQGLPDSTNHYWIDKWSINSIESDTLDLSSTSIKVKITYVNEMYNLSSEKEYIIEGFKAIEITEEQMVNALKESSFFKIKGSCNIFERTDLINQKKWGWLVLGDVYDLNNSDVFIPKFIKIIERLFWGGGVTFKVANQETNPWLIETSSGIATDGRTKAIYGKTLDEIKKENVLLFKHIKNYKLQFELIPSIQERYNGNSYDLFMNTYNLKANIIFNFTNDSSIKFENIWNNDNIQWTFLLQRNQGSGVGVELGLYKIYIPTYYNGRNWTEGTSIEEITGWTSGANTFSYYLPNRKSKIL